MLAVRVGWAGGVALRGFVAAVLTLLLLLEDSSGWRLDGPRFRLGSDIIASGLCEPGQWTCYGGVGVEVPDARSVDFVPLLTHQYSRSHRAGHGPWRSPASELGPETRANNRYKYLKHEGSREPSSLRIYIYIQRLVFP